MEPFEVATPTGPGRITVADSDAPRAVLLLGHGAGGGLGALDLTALASDLPARGIVVARYEQPWLVAGKRVAGPPATLDRAWGPALEALVERYPGVPLVVGGRSAGARVACRCFAWPAVGVVALSFPLHAPGKPEKSRAEELSSVPAPVLLVSGDRDPFGSPDELRAAIASGQAGRRHLVVVQGQAHSFRARKSDPIPVGTLIADAVADFVLALVGQA